ncbi:MAG: ABC transporter substrate-binding protein [Deltaproteobacteria bacterium]|nr:ABC transporter substrate-binding protein [Deltaproteobacteria bacterium]
MKQILYYKSKLFFWIYLIVAIFSSSPGLGKKNEKRSLSVAYFSQDIPALTSLFPAFDPDSYAVITQIFDSLVHFDLDGQPRPALATSWRRLSNTKWEFTLRKNVVFHNGEAFDGQSVKFTFDYILDPKNNAGNNWIFSTIDRVELDKTDPYKVYVYTKEPDGMFLNRFNIFSSICPPQYIKQHGIEYFHKHPVGTGPYVFKEWVPKKEIQLAGNEHYWQQGVPAISKLSFKIMDKDKWVDAINAGSVDFIPNLSGRFTGKVAAGNKIIKRLILSGYWVLLRNKGPLEDLKVRKALNFAVNKDDLVRYADYGNAKALASLGKEGEFGQDTTLKPYSHDLDKAKGLFKEAKVTNLRLKVLISDIAEPVGRIIVTNLRELGIEIEDEVVSRSEWANRIVGYKIQNKKAADYDLAINLVDNPIYHLGFHAGLFLASPSPWSLTDDSEFDRLYGEAMRELDPGKHERKMKNLDRYIHEQALMIFATQRIITAAVNKGLSIDTFGLNGHLNYNILSKAHWSD